MLSEMDFGWLLYNQTSVVLVRLACKEGSLLDCPFSKICYTLNLEFSLPLISRTRNDRILVLNGFLMHISYGEVETRQTIPHFTALNSLPLVSYC